MEKDCIAEIHGLHRFLAEWLTGALPDTDQEFARFAGVLAEGFVIIGPRGRATGRAALLDQLKGAHGAHADADPPFAIRIQNPRLRHQWEDHALLVYEEWQNGAPGAQGTTGRLSTALLIRDRPAPGGVTWLHLHETWIDNHGP